MKSRRHRPVHAFCILIFAICGSFSISAFATTNSWVYFDSPGHLAYQTWSNGNRIMDFSSCGYMGGGVAIPTNVATVVTVNPSGGDDTAAIKSAISTVSSHSLVNGFRGAVQLGAGTFHVSSQISISASGIVVRGAGSTNGTTIVMTNASPFTLFNAVGSGSPSQSGTVNMTDGYIPSGTNGFNVSSASGFSVGDSVIISRTVTTNWINYIGMEPGGPGGLETNQIWIPAGTVITTDRIISAISGNHITLDVPLADSFDTNYLGIPAGTMAKYSWSGRLSQVGIEHLRIQAPPADQSYISIYMDNIIDSWIRDVTIQDGVNSLTVKTGAKRVTVDSVNITRTVTISDAAPPWDFTGNGTQILFNKCRSEGTGVWPFLTAGESTGPIVLLNFYSSENGGISPHQRWSTALLSDNCSLPDAPSQTQGISYRNRINHGSGQGWTTGWSVAWNVVTPYFLVSAAPDTENWCIGGIGSETSTSDPDGIYDQLGNIVTPHSLYLEQLRERLGGAAIENIGYTLFTISNSPSVQSIGAVGSANFTVNVGDPTLMSNAVALSVSGLPANMGASFSTNLINGSGSATLTVTTSNGIAPATYTLNVIGANAGLTHTSQVSVIVGTFSLGASLASQSVSPGNSTNFTVTLTTNAGFGGIVNFGIAGLPSGANANFSPTSLSGNGTSTLTVTTTGATLAGSYPLTISGGNGTTTNTTTVMLVINPLPDFSLSITPNPVFVLGGNSTNATVAVNAINGFSDTVNLSVSGGTSHITAGLIPTAVAAPGTASLTFATDGTIPDGVYPFTVTGTNSTLTHTAAVNLVVMNIQLSATPATQTVFVGSNATYTISIATNSNFTGTANLGISGLPANATAAFAPTSLANAGSSTLTITAGITAVAGTYALTVNATNDSLVASVPVVLNVTNLLATPGTLLWTAGSGGGINWSTAPNWTNTTSGGNGQPGISNDVVLGSTATVGTSNTVDNIVDASPTINSLAFNNTNGFHTTQISSGATLTVAGSKGMTVGTESDLGSSVLIYDSVSGAGGSMVVSNASANVLVRQFTAGSSGIQRSTLDLSGLGNFTTIGNSIEVGTASATSTTRTAGTLYLAQSNTLELFLRAQGVTTNAGIDVADSPNANSSLNSFIYLGQQNAIYADGITVGGSRNLGWMGFNTNFANPTAFIRGTNGNSSRVSRWLIGDNSGASNTGSNSRGTNDFTGGTIDVLVDTMILGRGEGGSVSSGNSTGVLKFGAGTIDVNTLQMGVQAVGSTGGAGTGGGTNYFGQMDVDGTATLVVNSNLLMTVTNGGSIGAMSFTAVLNVNGGTVEATNIVGGIGTSTINLNSGIIDLRGSGQISNVTTIAIGDGISSTAQLMNAAKIISPNAINIATNGTLAGNTTVTTPNLIVGGTVSPGIAGPAPAIGSMTASAGITFNPGGAFAVAVQNANGSSGSGWDFLQAGGQLNVTATNINPFVIRLQSFDPNGSGLVTNFSADTSYDWIIATASGGITNFSADRFTVDTTQFQNDLEGGYFYVHTNNNSLILSFTNNHPPVVSGTVAIYRTGSLITIPVASLSTNWSDPDGDPVTLVTVNDSTNGASVSTDGAYIYYANPNNVADEFGYEIADVRTNPPAVYRPGDTVRLATGLVQILPTPFFGTVGQTAGTLMFTGSNGTPLQGFHILSTTNLTLPVSSWSLSATGAFDANGGFIFSNQIDPSVTNKFFILQVP